MTNPNLNTRIFEDITRNAIFAIAIFGKLDTECVYLNNIGFETLNLQPTDDPELMLHELFTKTERQDFISFKPAMLRTDGYYNDVMMSRPTGPMFVADLGIQNIKINDDEFTVLTFKDITLQKKMQRELTVKQDEIKKAFEEILEQNTQLKALDKSKDKFISLTTHELRTPLSAMIATSEVLALDLYDSEEQLKEFIQTIYKEGKHLLNIVNDILDFSKIQAGKMDFYIEEQNIKEKLADCAEIYEHMAEEKGIKIEISAEIDPPICYYDDLRITQVITNVMSNAIKFSSADSTVRIGVKPIEGFMQVSIADSGKGIPDEHADKIFNEFVTVGNINTHHKGTGLGMPISKKLMEGMGGAIHFKSKTDEGTTFFIDIPTEKILDDEVYRARPDFDEDFIAKSA
jgi:signal transduction histidine kinase